MATIQEIKGKSGKITYRAQVRKKGFPPQSENFDRKTDARKWAVSIEAAMEERRFRNVAQAKKRTVAELIDRYIENVLPKKPKSASIQKSQLLWWKQQLGMLTLADLTPDLFVDCRDKLAKKEVPSGALMSPATVNRYLAVMSHALNIAVKEYRWLPDSPMRDVSKLPEPKGRVRFLSDDERKRLLDACRDYDNPHLYVIVILAISTGMRKGEIMNLTWDDVDLEKKVIILQDTKNKERRAVPLVGRALELITELRSKRSNETDLLFPGKKPDKDS